MAARTSAPVGNRLLALTAKDVGDIRWFVADAEGVSGLRAQQYESAGGGNGEHDHTTVRQLEAATRYSRIEQIRELVPGEHWQFLSNYHAPMTAKVQDELAKRGSGTDGAERALRMGAVMPLTPTAQARARAWLTEQRASERRRRVAASPFRVVNVDGSTTEALHDHGEIEPRLWFGQRTKQDIRLMLVVFEENERRKAKAVVDTEWLPHEVFEAATKLLASDPELSSVAGREVLRLNLLAGDAWVRARRQVHGMDGEERRQAAADRWVAEQNATKLRTDAQAFIDSLERQAAE